MLDVTFSWKQKPPSWDEEPQAVGDSRDQHSREGITRAGGSDPDGQ